MNSFSKRIHKIKLRFWQTIYLRNYWFMVRSVLKFPANNLDKNGATVYKVIHILTGEEAQGHELGFHSFE